MSRNNQLFKEMISYYSGDVKRIQHFVKVYHFAKLIGEMELLDEDTQFILETAAIVHDIGIKEAEKKYGRSDGKLQEQEGPGLIEQMLRKLGYDREVIMRVCYLVGHHHTYQNIDGLDYQILVEADFLVNMYEDKFAKGAIEKVFEHIFKTEAGKQICKMMFALGV